MCNGTGSAYPIWFDAGGNSYFNTGGNVGIGTTSPQGSLHIAVASGAPALILSDVGSPNTLPTLQFRRGPLSAYSLQIDFPSNNKARLQIGDAVTGYEITGGNVGLTGGRSIEFGGVTGQVATGIIGSVQTDNNNGQLLFSTRGSGTTAERMRIFNDGNIGVGTSTNAGYKLDVNGTARFIGNVFLPTDILIGSGQSTSVWNRIMLYDSTNGSINITMHNTAWYIRHNANMSMNGAMQVGSNTSAVASAVLQATSTTQGFLPPRMTNAHRTAIASPAVGLIVYCTDATEGLWIYKSSGWTFIV
jgi:hypothetical protein